VLSLSVIVGDFFDVDFLVAFFIKPGSPPFIRMRRLGGWGFVLFIYGRLEGGLSLGQFHPEPPNLFAQLQKDVPRVGIISKRVGPNLDGTKDYVHQPPSGRDSIG
jgi:hypothetical protein